MQSIKLWSGVPPYAAAGLEDDSPTLTPYLVEGADSCVIVCPGGGYCHLADHEGGPVAEWLNQAGISAFVLKYRITPHRQPAALSDARRAVQYVRASSDKYGINPNKIAMLGFSAGGHLTASAGTMWVEGDPESVDHLEQVSSRPDRIVLCYPVITMEEYGHQGSKDALLGEKPDEELVRQYSAERQVTSQTPPAFIWHTHEDAAVPLQNSLEMSLSLTKAGVPHELHVFEAGRHGLGLAEELEETTGRWKGLCISWLKQQGW
ncbi:alpha/beta hydrolase [Paenibacillus urinalis]|uniref:alpha/beta hydrolase n=1 Tax=Paenibacillus urinalis TaxID=521520 RepID=UPI003636EBFE